MAGGPKKRRFVQDDNGGDDAGTSSKRARADSPAPIEEGDDLEPQEMDEESGNEEDDAEITRQASRAYNMEERRSAAECGVIKSIDCTNFMCHDHFRIDLCPSVNFIIGQNGAGKSAILTALKVCLGESASRTGRGAQLKDLIKHGCQYATVVVTLRNEGREAFQPEVYGDAIMIERNIQRTGPSNYKIKNSQNRLVSNAKKDLQKILDQFNIQVENPCAVLTQEQAKSFIASNKPEHKYELFMKATQLEQIRLSLLDVHQTTEQMARKKELYKKHTAPGLEESMNKAKTEYEEATALIDLEKKMEDFQKKLAWKIVENLETEVENLQKKMTDMEQKIAPEEAKLAKAQEKVEQYQVIESECDNKLQDLTQQFNRLRSQVNQYKQSQTALRSDEKKQKHEMKSLEKKLKSAKGETQRVQEEIQFRKDEMTKDKSDVRVQIEKQMEVKSLQVADLANKLGEVEKRDYECQDQARLLLDDLQAAQSEKAEFGRKLNQERTELDGYKRSQNNKMARFGPKQADLAKLVKEQKRTFQQAPIGPIGSYLNLTDKKWGLAVDSVLGMKGLSSWMVSSKGDEEKLSKLMARVKMNASIYICAFTQGPYALEKIGDGRFVTMNDIIRIQEKDFVISTTIRNLLVDHFNIERHALVSSYEDGKQAAHAQNVKSAIMNNGESVYVRNHSMTTVPPRRDLSDRLTADASEIIRNLEASTRHMASMLDEQSASVLDLQKQKQAAEQEIRTCKKQIGTIDKSMRQKKNEINDLESRLLDETAVVDDLTEIEAELEAKQEEEVEIQDEIARFTKQVMAHKIDERIVEFASLIAESHRSAETVGAQLKDVETEATSNFAERRVCESKCKLYQDKVRKYTAEFKNIKDATVAKTQEAEHGREVVTQSVGEQVTSKESKETLESKLEGLQKRIQKEQTRKGNRSAEEITNAFLMGKKKFEMFMEKLEGFGSQGKNLANELGKRRVHWYATRKNVSRLARIEFMRYLGKRSFEGDLAFDHKGKALEFEVRTHVDSEIQKSISDLKALSGGERSFSTICFLLALGEITETPFRAMDEFDVFMDAVNRRVSLELLMDVALETQAQRQFIFITPNNVSWITAKYPDRNLVKVLQMRPPVRGDQTQIEEFFTPRDN